MFNGSTIPWFNMSSVIFIFMQSKPAFRLPFLWSDRIFVKNSIASKPEFLINIAGISSRASAKHIAANCFLPLTVWAHPLILCAISISTAPPPGSIFGFSTNCRWAESVFFIDRSTSLRFSSPVPRTMKVTALGFLQS